MTLIPRFVSPGIAHMSAQHDDVFWYQKVNDYQQLVKLELMNQVFVIK